MADAIDAFVCLRLNAPRGFGGALALALAVATTVAVGSGGGGGAVGVGCGNHVDGCDDVGDDVVRAVASG